MTGCNHLAPAREPCVFSLKEQLSELEDAFYVLRGSHPCLEVQVTQAQALQPLLEVKVQVRQL